MKHISILIPRGHTSLSNIEGTHQILTEANSLGAGMGRPPLFNIQLIGLSKETSQRNGLFTVKPDCLMRDVKKTDLIIQKNFIVLVASLSLLKCWMQTPAGPS